MATTIGSLVATFTAETRDFETKTRALESRIESLKARIKEVKAEAASPFKGPRTEALEGRLRGMVAQHKALQVASKGSVLATRQSAVAMNDLSGALGVVSPRLGALAGAAGPLTAVAVALGAVAGAGAGIYKLATFSAELGAEIYDLSQKINFSAETLSSLKVAAELSGGSLASLSTSFGIFDRNMEQAREGGNEMSRVFKTLKIDTLDNEKALRQAFTALAGMAGGAQQTAVAMKLFGRSGKEVLGIVKETGGDVDKFIERMREMGLVITTSGAKKADEFTDKMTMVQGKLAAIARQIGAELIPTVERAADDISRWLKANQGEILKTAKEIGSLVAGIYSLAKTIQSLSPLILEIKIIKKISEVLESLPTPMSTNMFGAAGLGSSAMAPPGMPSGIAPLSAFRGQQVSSPFSMAPHSFKGAPKPGAMDFGGGGGGGGGGRGGGGGGAAKDSLKGLKDALMGLNTEYRKFNTELLNSASASELASEKEKILSSVMQSLGDNTKMAISQVKDIDQALDKAIGSLPAKSQGAAKALLAQALAQFKLNEETRLAGVLNKQAEDITKDWREEIDDTRSGADEYTKQIQSLEQAFAKYGLTLDAGTRKELDYLAAMQRTLKVTRERLTITAQTRERVVGGDILKELGGGSAVFRGEATRPRVATVETQVMRERLEMLRERMSSLAGEITNVWDRALYDGISGGAKRGLQSMSLGFLDMIHQIVLGRLKSALAEALGGASGGGGLLGGLLKAIGLGAISGAAGGAVGGAFNLGGGSTYTPGGTGAIRPRIVGAGRAMGGPVSAGLPYEVHKDELIVPTQAGMVYNKSQQGGVTNYHYNITLPPVPRGSYTSPRSKREMADALVSAIQGAQS